MTDERPEQTLNNISSTYLDSIKLGGRNGVSEYEVRFGTARRMKRISRLEYDAVIKKLISSGFILSETKSLLRINSEFIDKRGVTKTSRIRAELSGLGNISAYCKSNDIKEFVDSRQVKFVEKKTERIDGEFVPSYDAIDYNFRAAISNEKDLTNSRLVQGIVNSWKDNKKVFRYVTRHELVNPNYPLRVDISIVKESAREGRYMKSTFTFDESRVVQSPEIYEIEIEVENYAVGIGTRYNTAEELNVPLKKVINLVLSALQGTNYPIAYSKQTSVLNNYMRLLWKTEHRQGRRVTPKNFVGPSSYTLQTANIAPINEDANIPNIRKDYTVTDKADGERKLMMIDVDGKIYLIDTNMNVQYTGSRTKNTKLFNTLLDGEHIFHNKSKKYINLYAAFDVYYIAGKDVRAKAFTPEKDENPMTCRLPLLVNIIEDLKPVYGQGKKEKPSPMRFENKTFYVSSDTGTIFNACKSLLEKVNNGLFEYETDGLIFTPSRMGVGGNSVGETTKPLKKTWDHSFKWKPTDQNTIDFLITIQKGSDGRDNVKSIFEGGIDVNNVSQITQYKTVILRVGFDEARHGYTNPCKNIIDDKLPDFGNKDDAEGYRPMQFFPTNPTDNNAGICNLLLQETNNGEKVMFAENRDIIEDNMIVEFRYDVTRDNEWKWVPIRVRYDKTADFRNGGRNYGNAYHVANSNWHTIHNPISEEMIITGLNIPDELGDDDVYYNRVTNATNTRALRDFHNLYIKKKLIKSASKRGDTLIDLAVGKAGDFSKWIDSKLKFVFGIDISRDNINNRLDGACARYLNYRKRFNRMPSALFVAGNSSVNVRDTDAIFTDKGKQITKAVFGKGPKDAAQLGKGVYKHYGIGENGFDICSVQFAIHYMFENPRTLNNFLRNVSETTAVGGYFIGTSYDGAKVFSMLKSKNQGESVIVTEDDKKLWQITKDYDRSTFTADSSSLGYAINVYQESINKTFKEYLVNYNYLDRLMENYGFTPLTREEAKSIGLPSNSGSFKELYSEMKREMERNSNAKNEYGTALKMTTGEKTVSFLNRYFIYKKRNAVDAKQVANNLMGQLSLENETEEKESINATDAVKNTIQSIKKQEPVKKPKKLKKKLKLRK